MTILKWMALLLVPKRFRYVEHDIVTVVLSIVGFILSMYFDLMLSLYMIC